jgi:hypothetical protein
MMGVLEWRLNFVKHNLEGMVDNMDKDRWLVDNQDMMVVDNNSQDMDNRDMGIGYIDAVDTDVVDMGMAAVHLVGCQVWLEMGAVVCVVIEVEAEVVVDIGIAADDL